MVTHRSQALSTIFELSLVVVSLDCSKLQPVLGDLLLGNIELHPREEREDFVKTSKHTHTLVAARS